MKKYTSQISQLQKCKINVLNAWVSKYDKSTVQYDSFCKKSARARMHPKLVFKSCAKNRAKNQKITALGDEGEYDLKKIWFDLDTMNQRNRMK